jgi:hypothetical protein
MREAFGHCRVIEHLGRPALEAVGLDYPVPLLDHPTAGEQPDFKSLFGKTVFFSGWLCEPPGTLDEVMLIPMDIQIPASEQPIGELMVAVTGNLGDDPSENPRGDRVAVSVAYASDDTANTASWLRVVATKPSSFGDVLLQMPRGSAALFVGALSAYTYKGKPRCHIEVRAASALRLGGAPKPAESVFSARPALTQEPARFRRPGLLLMGSPQIFVRKFAGCP